MKDVVSISMYAYNIITSKVSLITQLGNKAVMEKTTSIFTLVSQRWILCTLASFLGVFLLIFGLKFPSRLDFMNIESMTIATTTTQLKNFTANVYYTDDQNPAKSPATQLNGTKDEGLLVNEPKKKCDIFNGRWVYDPKASPLYKATQCSFLSDQVSCRKNGRPDFEYERWRWEAMDCEIPRLDGKEMLERLRGKRVIIVGDSLNRNQWESLACLLYSAIPSKRGAYINVHNGEYKIFKAKDYNCSVEFHWSPFLVQLDDTQSKKNSRILKLDRLSTSARRWRGADIMVFNTGHWWIHSGKLRAWDFFQHKGKLIEELDLEIAFRFAMKAWAHWIDLNVDPVKTTVFFRSISPSHKGQQWCYNQTQPIKDESYENSFPEPIIDILEKTIREMRTPVTYLNITKLSQYRKDAHPTVYTTKQGKLLTKEQRSQPKLYADCNHWCLPGLPDTWNSLLFTSIILDSSRDIL